MIVLQNIVLIQTIWILGQQTDKKNSDWFWYTTWKWNSQCWRMLLASTEECIEDNISQKLENFTSMSGVTIVCPVQFSSVQLLSRVRLFATPWITAHQASLCIPNSQSLLKLMSIELVMPSRHLILCHPLLLLPPITPSIRVFSNESVLCIRELVTSEASISVRSDWLQSHCFQPQCSQ